VSLAETLFEAEAELRKAANDFAKVNSNTTRGALRRAALDYAKHANYIDELQDDLQRYMEKVGELAKETS
jgi:hypothetical protein